MSALILTIASLELLRAALIHGGSGNLKLVRVGDSAQAISLQIETECTEHRIRLRAAMVETTGELSLDPHHPGFFDQARGFLEDLANGRIDTGALPPAEQAQASPEPTAMLSTDDERTLRAVSRHGGSATLSTGTLVNVHTGSLEDAPLHTAIAVHGARTHLVSGSAQDVYLSLAEHIQQFAA